MSWWTKGALVVVSASCALALSATAVPDAAQAARGCGALKVRASVITLTATRIVAFRRLSCLKSRRIVRSYFRQQLTDFEGCAVPAKNAPYDGCAVASYTCLTRNSGAARCEGPRGEVIRFIERDATSG